MPVTVVVGAQWGDEGKAKVIDLLAAEHTHVVRYQGGHNAGHTLVVDGETFALQLVPSGVLYDHIVPVIGNGVVVDPWHLVAEIEKLRGQGVEISPGSWEVITSIFCHLHPDLRGPLHRAVVRGLAPGGVFALEAYTPGQLTRGTGGPSDPAMLPTLEILRHELEGLEFMHARELERDVVEGHLHTGAACVVQVLARRP